MQSDGMTIGLHGYSHKPFSMLSSEELSTELEYCTSFFRDYLNDEVLFLSYPFGDHDSVNENNIEIIKKFNIKYAFFAETTGNEEYYHLSRSDCSELNRKICKGKQ